MQFLFVLYFCAEESSLFFLIYLGMVMDIDAFLKKYEGSQRDMIITILEQIQEEYGYISEEAIIKTGKLLKMPASKIFGVTTFYDHFLFSPPAHNAIKVCNGTACHVLGSAEVLKELENTLQIKSGETTRDGSFSIVNVPCIGACGCGPVITINREFYPKTTSNAIKQIIESCKNEMQSK